MADRYIDYLPLAEIAGAPRNPKGHDEAGIRASIEEFGFVEPIVRDERTGRLVAGHGRLERLRAMYAAKSRRKTPPDGVKLAGDGGWLIPVNRGWSSTDDAHAEAYVVAANRLVERGGWDNLGLAEILTSLQDLGPKLLAAAGFDDAQLGGLLDSIAAVTPLPAPDDDPTPPAAPGAPVISTAGDVWLLGPHRLAVGDATDPDVIKAALGGDLAQLLLTDPPYGVSYVGRTEAALRIAGDDDGAPALLADVLAALEPHLAAGAAFYVFHASESIAMQQILRTPPWRVRQCLVWCKSAFSLGRADYHYSHEPIADGDLQLARVDATFETVAYGNREGGPARGRGRRAGGWYGGNAESTVLHYPKPQANPDHPTPKPVPLLERLIRNSTRRGHIVADPFAGSGSTLIACHNVGRLARLAELDPVYADGICRRWQLATKTPPLSEATGLPVDFVGPRE